MIGKEIRYAESLDSTNLSLSKLLRTESVEEGLVLRTDFQIKGRGYSKNHWESAAGENLLFSFILKPHFLNASEQFEIAKMVSLAIHEYLHSFAEGFKIKWPNDLFFGDKKIAGMLIEHSVHGDQLSHSIVGIGLNLNQEQFSEQAGRPVSLRTITQASYHPQTEMNKLIDRLNAGYARLRSGDRRLMHEEYLQHLYRFDEWSTYQSGDLIFEGRIRGVNEFGQLLLERKNGSYWIVSFKEVEFL